MAKSKKNIKKSKNSKKVLESIPNNTKISNIVKVVVAVAIVLGITYLLTVTITKNSTDGVVKKTFDNTSVQYDEILAGTSFNQKDKEYYVLFYDVDNDTESAYYTLKSNYEAKDDALPFYYVDLGSSFNSDCVSEESNSEATKADELEINDATLIKFSEGKISEYIVGKDDISAHLG